MIGVKNLSISTLNLNGSRVGGWKLSDESLIKKITDHDIFGVIEAWTYENSDIEIPNYYSYNKYRNLSKNARRASGGIICYIKRSIKHGVRILGSANENLLWLELKKEVFNFVKPVYLCLCYIPPVDSVHLKDAWLTLENEILSYSKNGFIALSGDFNSRISGQLDFIQNDSTSHLSALSDLDYICDEDINPRHHFDNVVNRNGRSLIDLCISSKLRILNGRHIGDYFGNFTYFKVSQGNIYKSTIDYAIVSEELLRSTRHFCVHTLDLALSDHCQISFDICFETNTHFDNVNNNTVNLKPFPSKYIWGEDSKERFINAFKNVHIKSSLNYLSNVRYLNEQSDIDQALSDMNSIYIKAAELSLKKSRKRSNDTNSKKIKRHQKWFTNDLKLLRNDIKSLSSAVSKDPKNTFLGGLLRRKCNTYNKQIKKAKRESKEMLIRKLCQSEKNDPGTFWKTMKELNESGDNNSLDECDTSRFCEYFERLVDLPHNVDNVEQTNTLPPLNIELNTEADVELNKPFTICEIKKMIRKLKNGKAVGFDLISNEMIKTSAEIMLPLLTKVFNLILKTSKSPSNWKFGYIFPIYKKKGDVSDPGNYRGITVTSCLCKLFSAVLNQRLEHFISKNHILNDCQSGFRKKARTSDNIFIIKSIVNKYFNMGKKIYCCFVDFKKAFDSVWHDGLFYKLASYGINGNFLKYIKHLYSSMESCLKFPQGISNFFQVKIGTRQGDVLSPTLFNLFINDIIDQLQSVNSDPAIIDNYKVTTLLYADDLVIISTSPKGLQSCIDVLSNYCKKWKLQINKDKSKIMIFEKNKEKNVITPKFRIDGELLCEVSEFVYLGTLLDKKCNLKCSADALSNKGSKALYVLMKMINSNNLNPHVAIRLFNCYIKPIITYNCEVWGSCFFKCLLEKEETRFMKSFDKYSFENIMTKFCKWILGVNKYTSNCGSRAELGVYPIMFHIFKHTINYLKHIPDSDNGILKAALENDKSLKSNSIFNSVSDILQFLNTKNTSAGISLTSPEKDIMNSLEVNYQKSFFTFINIDKRDNPNQKNKLRTYRTFKTQYVYEDYLNIINNRSILSKFARFRLSNHDLYIEKGRHLGIDANRRLCPFDCGKIEDEFHFFSECICNGEIRSKFIEKHFQCENKGTPFTISYNDFTSCMSSHNSTLILETALFVYRSLNNRKVTLQTL